MKLLVTFAMFFVLQGPPARNMILLWKSCLIFYPNILSGNTRLGAIITMASRFMSTMQIIIGYFTCQIEMHAKLAFCEYYTIFKIASDICKRTGRSVANLPPMTTSNFLHAWKLPLDKFDIICYNIIVLSLDKLTKIKFDRLSATKPKTRVELTLNAH